MGIHQFAPPSPPFIWWGDQPDSTSDVIRLSGEVLALREKVAALEAKLQSLHDEFAAEARSYGSFTDDDYEAGMITGRTEKAEDVRDRLAEILKEFA